jgi:hypothetical protein
VVDLSKFKKITVDSAKHTAVIETGNRLGDVALALSNAGRALPHGTCPYVGMGGHSGMLPLVHSYHYRVNDRFTRLWWIWVHVTNVGTDSRHYQVYQHGPSQRQHYHVFKYTTF